MPLFCQTVAIPLLPKEQIETFFLLSLEYNNRRITAAQRKAVLAVLEKNPLPAMVVMLVAFALEWTSETVVTSSDLPNTVGDALVHLCKQAEQVVGKECVLRVLGYLCRSK